LGADDRGHRAGLSRRPGRAVGRALSATPGEPVVEPDEDARPVHQSHGEGLGLAIVKRLSEILNATSSSTPSRQGHDGARARADGLFTAGPLVCCPADTRAKSIQLLECGIS
jgi:hypothetical protein